MSDVEKICVMCGQSCAGQPRIKNEKGQYAHRACVQAKQESEPVVADDGLYDDYDDALGGMDDLLGDIAVHEEVAIDGAAMACPGCGTRMEAGSVVCMGCGYNTQSGKAMNTKSTEIGEGFGGAAIGGVAQVGGLAASPMLPFIGALIGGAIGASIWAAIAYFTGFEVGYVAIGVGALVGIGATLGGGAETTGGGAIAGAMGSIAGGKYAASYFAVKDFLGNGAFSLTLEEIDDEMLISGLVDDVCREQIANGEPIEWENMNLYSEAAWWPEDYPSAIQTVTRDAWDSKSSVEKSKFRRDISDEFDDVSMHDVDDEWALQELADEICKQKTAAGEEIRWEDHTLPLRAAEWPVDYPQAIVDTTNDRYNGMSDDDIEAYRSELLDRYTGELGMSGDMAQEITKQNFIQSFMHPFDILFMLLAVSTAYGIAAND